MSDLILVHGACHGAWCWDLVLPELAALGLTARAVDLPGRGADRTPPDCITLDHHADAILAALDRPAILIGHSAGGYAIAAAALKRPDLVARLIYLTAWIPVPGKSLADLRRAARPEALTRALHLAPDRLTYSFAPESYAETFAQDAPPDVVAQAVTRLCPEPTAPHETPLPSLPDAPAFALFCDDDRAIPPALQRDMAQDIPEARTLALPTSHSPFLSRPRALAEALARLATAPG